MVVEPDDEGGDPACWLDRVCDACGAVIEGDPDEHACRPDAGGVSRPAGTG